MARRHWPPRVSLTQDSKTTSGFDRWFELTKRRSTIGREIRGGVVTFVTMAYIVVLGPLILGTAKDSTGSFIGGFSDVAQSIPAVAAAMGLVVLEGVVVLILVLVGLRKKVFDAIPEPMKYAIGVGIGLFITLIGLVDAGISVTLRCASLMTTQLMKPALMASTSMRRTVGRIARGRRRRSCTG